MAHLLTWPKQRALTDAAGARWRAVVSPGLLSLVRDDGDPGITFTNVDELRAFAMQAYAAAIDHDQSVQHAAAKASADRRARRQQAGTPTGLRHRPYDDDDIQPSMLTEAREATA